MIECPKISVIMQSYLSEYEGSRKNPIEKFHRSVRSFLDNTYKNSELVIVSDSCQITHNEYHSNYSGNNRIKYVFISKPSNDNMYQKVDGQNTYRGEPRAIGVSVAQGKIITYLYSDDYLIIDGLQKIIEEAYLKSPDSSWWINMSHFDEKSIALLYNKITSMRNDNIQYNKSFDKLIDILEPFENKVYRFGNIEADFVKTTLKKGHVTGVTFSLTHKKDININWRNTIGTSEDVDFSRRLREKYKGHLYNEPIYVRCHYRGVWDV